MTTKIKNRTVVHRNKRDQPNATAEHWATEAARSALDALTKGQLYLARKHVKLALKWTKQAVQDDGEPEPRMNHRSIVAHDTTSYAGHQRRRVLLHAVLDELLADFLTYNPDKDPSSTTVAELLTWSNGEAS